MTKAKLPLSVLWSCLCMLPNILRDIRQNMVLIGSSGFESDWLTISLVHIPRVNGSPFKERTSPEGHGLFDKTRCHIKPLSLIKCTHKIKLQRITYDPDDTKQSAFAANGDQ